MSTTITFQSRKDALFIGVMVFAISACLFPIGAILYKNPLNSEGLIALSLLVGTTLLLVSFFTHTYYVIDHEQIKWRSGPLKGVLNIDEIKEIVVGTSVYVGMRPATARNGVLVRFNMASTKTRKGSTLPSKFLDEIYFSPSDNELFVEAILMHNPNVQIKRS